jgi:internalin A
MNISFFAVSCPRVILLGRLSSLCLFVLILTTGGHALEKEEPPAVRSAKRTWKNSQGKSGVEAQFLGVKNNTVRLRKSDGSETTLPLDRLSAADQSYVQSELLKSLDQKIVSITTAASHEVDARRGYSPKSLELTEKKPSSLKSVPDNLSVSPLYGAIPLGDAEDTVLVILDITSDGKPRLIVDRNNDKDLADEADVEVKSDQPGYWQGTVTIDVRYKTGSEPYSLNLYQWSQNTSRSIAYYRNTTRTGKLKIGIKDYAVSIIDDTSLANFTKAQVSIDFQGKGNFTSVNPEEFVFGDLSCELLDISPDGKTVRVRCYSIAGEPRLSVALEPVHGVRELVKYSVPISLTLSKDRPFELKAEPKYRSTQPLYGSLSLGENTQLCIVVDEPENDYWRIFVDANGDRDLTNDGDGAWSVDHGSGTALNGCLINVAYKSSKQPYALNFYRNAGYPDKLSYYRDTVRAGKIRIAKKEYPLFVLNDANDGRFDDLQMCQLLLDMRNGEKDLEPYTISTSEQAINGLQPLRLGTSTLQVHSISADGSRLTLRAPRKKFEFDGRLALMGEKVPELPLKTLDGKPYVVRRQPQEFDYTILHVWDSRAACLEHLPEIARIADRYRSSTVRIIGIFLGDDVTLARKVVKAWNLDFVQLWDERGSKSPLSSRFYNSYGVAAPRVVVLNDNHLVVDPNANNPWSIEKRLLTLVGKGDASVQIPQPASSGSVKIPSRPMAYEVPESPAELTHLCLYGQNDIGDKDLAKLAGASQLVWLELYGTKVTDDGLRHLAGLSKLEALFIGETGISDAGLASLASLKNLKCLNIQKNPGITDAGMELLSELHDLEVLNVYGTRVSDDGLGHLHKLSKLRHLNVIATLVGPGGQQSILNVIPECSFSEYPSEWYPDYGQSRMSGPREPGKIIVRLPGTAEKLIESLEMSQVQFTSRQEGEKTVIELADQHLSHLTSRQEIEEMEYRTATPRGLASIAGMTGLRSLDLLNSGVGDSGVAKLKNMKQLKRLNLWGTDITDVSLQNLKDLSQLESLILLQARLTDEGMTNLKHFPLLSELNLSHIPITDQALVHVAQLSLLKNLDLTGTKISDAGLPALRSLKNLNWLSLDSTEITGKTLGALSDLEQLNELRVTRAKLNDESLKVISTLPAIKRLVLANNDLSAEGIKALASLRTLEQLFLGSTSIDDSAVQHIVKMENVTSLGLDDTKVTDKGLKQLAELKSLRNLYITEKVFSQEAIDGLKTALPQLQIVQSAAQQRVPTRKIFLKREPNE